MFCLIYREIHNELVMRAMASQASLNRTMVPDSPMVPAYRPALTLLHDDQEDVLSLQDVPFQKSSPPSSDLDMVSQSSVAEKTTPSGNHPQQHIASEKIPLPAAASHQVISQSADPRHLFRPVLLQPTQLSADPWFMTSEDMVLDRMWDPTGQLRQDVSKFSNCPSTGDVIHSLQKKRQRSRNAINEIDDGESKPRTTDIYNNRAINQTRMLLEKLNILREAEDMKTREVSILFLNVLKSFQSGTSSPPPPNCLAS